MNEHILNTLANHNYKFISLIGRGGFSVCLKVLSLKYGAEFACKIIILKDSERSKKAYMSELSSLLSVNNTFIVNVYDHFIENDFFYIILEYCEKQSLDYYLKDQTPLPKADANKYIHNIIEAICAIHKTGLAHHDIKPGNFFIDRNDRAKLGDFGIAMKYSRDEKSTFFGGSLLYSAPEIFKKQPYDPYKADIWSFGVSVFQLVTGELPFKGDTKVELSNTIMTGSYKMPTGIDPLVREIIFKCLKTDPSERPCAEQLRDIIKPWYKRPNTNNNNNLPLIVRPNLRKTMNSCVNFSRVSTLSLIKKCQFTEII